jgi:drug/metabolite transporter (DMT)-like permease
MQAVILLLSSATPAIKYIFQHSHLGPIHVVCIRVSVGFVFLLIMTLIWDRRGLASLNQEDMSRLVLLGFFGVGLSYCIAAWGLLYTSVSHYVLIYSLLPSFTVVFGYLLGKEQPTGPKIFGIVLSFCGVIISISELFDGSYGRPEYGDLFVVLFTLIMSVYLVLSAGIVKRYGAMTANTVMFGGSALLLSIVASGEFVSAETSFSPATVSLLVYVGAATGGVFLLRYLALQSLPPATVGAFHNLVPVCAILFAYLFLDEPLHAQTILGGATILAGTELVRRT